MRRASMLAVVIIVAGTLAAAVSALPPVPVLPAGAAANNVNQSFITGAAEPFGVVVDQNYIYWANFSAGTIGRANLDGDPTSVNQSFITGASGPSGIVVSDNYIYWANQTGNTIGRANLDGSSVDQAFISTPTPIGVAIDASYIYWTDGDSNAIGRANLDGSSVDQAFITGADVSTGIAVNGSSIYWANEDGNTIGQANIDGDPASVNQSFITGADSPGGIVIDQTSVYWANVTGDTIGQASLDGSSVNQSFISGASEPVGVWVDSNDIYWSNASANTIGAADLVGPLSTIVLSPATASIGAGGSQSYTATGYDASGNSLGDITAMTSFSIAPDGSCTASSCSATAAGTHTVTATDGSIIATTSLTVNASSLSSIVVNPASASISVGGAQSYSAIGYDVYDNPLGDVTGSTAFSIAPDGSCTGVVCSASAAGNHTVTGTDGAVTGTASLNVTGITLPLLTITASSGTMAEGAAVPTITASYSGFVNGDNSSSLTVVPTCSTTATNTSPTGTYPTSCSGAVDSNYDISYVTGTVSVVASGGFQITTTSLPPATLSTRYGFQLQATGGVPPYKWKVANGRLPKGVKLTSHGTLHGFANSRTDDPGTFNITVEAQDHRSKKQGGKQTAIQSLTFTLTSAT